MILHTTEVTPLSDHRLFLRFNNGDAGELDGEVFEPLRDRHSLRPRTSIP